MGEIVFCVRVRACHVYEAVRVKFPLTKGCVRIPCSAALAPPVVAVAAVFCALVVSHW